MFSLAFCRRSPAILPAFQLRQFAVTGRHSKNVAGKKNKLDMMRLKLYDKLAKQIIMAVKSGGRDPESNPTLGRAIKNAQANKLPKDNIERAMKKGMDKDSVNYAAQNFEVFGHGSVGIIVKAVTDNPNRANQNIKAAVKAAEAKIAGMGSVVFNFEEKAMYTPTDPFNSERVMVAALDGDLDDIDFIPHPANTDEEELPELVITEPESLGTLQDMMADLGIPGSASLVYVPQDRVRVSEENWEKNSDLIEALEELEDVEAVFHNMER